MRLITPPQGEPISLEAARQWARVDEAEPDEIVALCLQAAREKAEHTTGRRLLTQTWAIPMTAGQRVALHGLMPVQEVRQGGAVVPHSADLPAEVVAPSDGELEVKCGFGGTDDVPSAIKMWILQRLGYYLENRQGLVAAAGVGTQLEPPRDFVDGLLDPFIVPRC